MILSLRSITILLVLFLQPAHASGEPKQRLDEAIFRTKQEAATLVSNVLHDHVSDRQPCIFSKQWSDRPVDVTLAREYLGLSFYADVSAPHTGTAPADIIDPAGQMLDYFCSEAEANEMWSQRLASLSQEVLPKNPDQGDQRIEISMRRVDISMPVFNEDYSTAVVNISYMRRKMTKGQVDKIKKFSEGVGYSFVYRKMSGGWTLIHSTEDYTFH